MARRPKTQTQTQTQTLALALALWSLPAGFSQAVADQVLGGLRHAARALEGMAAG